MDSRLQQRLEKVATRKRNLGLAKRLAVMWFSLAAMGAIALWLSRQQGWQTGPQIALALATAATLLTLWFGARALWRGTDLAVTARSIEDHYPTLNERLLAALHQQPHRADGSFGYLQKRLIDDTVAHDREHSWLRVVPSKRLAIAWSLNLPGFIAFLVVVASLTLLARQSPDNLATANSVGNNTQSEPIIVPGDTEVERGSNLIVTAQFAQQVPAQVAMQRRYLKSASSNNSEGAADNTQVPMRRALDDPLFAAYLTDIQTPLTYNVQYDGRRTREYSIKIFDYPAVVRTDVELVYPVYTKLEKKSIADTHRISAVVGSELTWLCHVNKPITRAWLVDEQEHELPLSVDENDSQLLRTTVTVADSRNWQVRLLDEAGRSNKVDVKLSLKALPNVAPTIKLATGDVRVSPIEEFLVSAKVTDDFGLERMGLSYQMAGEEPVEVDLTTSQDESSKKSSQLAQLIALEDLKAQPDQLMSYYVWVEDRDEQNQLRRISSDMFFAEVRPFDEIFREGETQSAEQQRQQQQQPAGGAGETEELLELQKQILAGTWNVLRKSGKSNLSEKSAEDVKVLAESQAAAFQLLAEKASAIDVPGAEELVATASQHMQNATERLKSASISQGSTDLKTALAAEQSAYQSLLKLQAKEFEVTQNQQQSGRPSRSARSRARQQQLDQLKLENRENRYENERLARTEEQPENGQLRQVQSRLRELAARQEDLNEQIRELQAALQAADDELARKEIEKRLERLREQQQQMLEDADELREQLDNQTSSEALAEAQNQMEQTRENLRQTSEALNQGQTSQALASGTRAEQELKELQDKVRQESANQFTETMRQMQSDAAVLESKQQELSEQLKSTEKQTTAGLRGSQHKGDLETVAAEQQARLKILLKEMRTAVESAEEPEPLLAQRLYDTFRKTEQQQTDRKLETTKQLLQRNLTPQAQQMAEQTKTDISQLREGIDQAAEAVLGNEVDSLRLALDQLQQLSRQVDQEVATAIGEPAAGSDTASDPSQNNPGQESAAENVQEASSTAQQNQSASNQSQQSQPGQSQPGQSQASQSQSSQGPSGQNSSAQDQPGQKQSEQSQSAQNQSTQNQSTQNQTGQSQSGQTPAGQGQPGASQSSGPPAGLRPDAQSGMRQDNQRSGSNRQNSGSEGGNFEQFSGERLSAPITGNGFRNWSDRLREVEELVSDPEMRGRATQIRQAARGMRSEVKKHAAEPQWELVKELVADPLRELQHQVSQELLRRASDKNSLVPIDRDPVPGQYSESVRRYYENLGSGR